MRVGDNLGRSSRHVGQTPTKVSDRYLTSEPGVDQGAWPECPVLGLLPGMRAISMTERPETDVALCESLARIGERIQRRLAERDIDERWHFYEQMAGVERTVPGRIDEVPA